MPVISINAKRKFSRFRFELYGFRKDPTSARYCTRDKQGFPLNKTKQQILSEFEAWLNQAENEFDGDDFPGNFVEFTVSMKADYA